MKRSTVLYLDVAEKIKKDIYSGKYPVGSLLPTESDFEEMFGVSKITVRKAIELLAADELVAKRAGRGTTVLSDRPYNKLSKTTSFTQILESSDARVEKRVLGLDLIATESGGDIAEHFGPQALRYRRLYLLNGKPYIYFTHYLPADIAEVGREQLTDDSLYRILNQRGYEIARFDDDFSAVHFSEEERAVLETGESIGIRRVRVSRDGDGRTVEYSVALYDTAQRPYRIEYEA